MAEPNVKKKSRFATTTTDQEHQLMDERVKKNTQRATKNAIKTLEEYLMEKNHKPFDELADDELPDILYHFYTDLRKVDGGMYKLQTLKCLRAGINRYTKDKRNLDIIKDLSFTKTNEMFKAVTTRARKEGRGSTKNYPPIEDDDMAKLAEYFDHDFMNQPDPKRVQKCAIFYIIYWFCRRGRENLYEMTTSTFEIGTEADGKQFVFQAIDEQDKNHGLDNPLPAKQGRMYEQPGSYFHILLLKFKEKVSRNPKSKEKFRSKFRTFFSDCHLCPVAIWRLYTSKLNKDVPFLWQRPKQGTIYYTDECWYDRVRVGHTPLESYMQLLSAQLSLSKAYTNHSIRSTVMGILGDEFEGREVIIWSGHASEGTIKQYVKRLPEKKKREMSEALAQNILPKKAKVQDPPQQPIPHIQNENIQPNLQVAQNVEIEEAEEPTFDLQFGLEEMADGCDDAVLNKFLDDYEKNMQVAVPNPPQAPEVLVPNAMQNPMPNAMMNK